MPFFNNPYQMPQQMPQMQQGATPYQMGGGFFQPQQQQQPPWMRMMGMGMGAGGPSSLPPGQAQPMPMPQMPQPGGGMGQQQNAMQQMMMQIMMQRMMGQMGGGMTPAQMGQAPMGPYTVPRGGSAVPDELYMAPGSRPGMPSSTREMQVPSGFGGYQNPMAGGQQGQQNPMLNMFMQFLQGFRR